MRGRGWLGYSLCATVAVSCAPAASESLLDPAPGSGVLLDGRTTCADFVDLEARNRRERLRLGFALSRVVLRGRLEPPTDREMAYARLTVEHVARGPTDWRSRRLLVPWQARWARERGLPAEVWVGLRWSNVDAQARVGAPLAVSGLDEADDFRDVLGRLPEDAVDAERVRAAWVDAADLATWAARYRYAWTFCAAPRVLLAETTGHATWPGGALRVAALYDVLEPLSGPPAPTQIEVEYETSGPRVGLAASWRWGSTARSRADSSSASGMGSTRAGNPPEFGPSARTIPPRAARSSAGCPPPAPCCRPTPPIAPRGPGSRPCKASRPGRSRGRSRRRSPPPPARWRSRSSRCSPRGMVTA